MDGRHQMQIREIQRHFLTDYLEWMAMHGYLLHLHTDVFLSPFLSSAFTIWRFLLASYRDGTTIYIRKVWGFFYLCFFGVGPLLWGDGRGIFLCTCLRIRIRIVVLKYPRAGNSPFFLLYLGVDFRLSEWMGEGWLGGGGWEGGHHWQSISRKWCGMWL